MWLTRGNLYTRVERASEEEVAWLRSKESGLAFGNKRARYSGAEPEVLRFFDLEDKRFPAGFTPLVVDRAKAGVEVVETYDRSGLIERAVALLKARDFTPEDFARFASAFAARYATEIDVYQVWDEPNLRSGWGVPPAPAGYAALAANEAEKAANISVLEFVSFGAFGRVYLQPRTAADVDTRVEGLARVERGLEVRDADADAAVEDAAFERCPRVHGPAPIDAA